MLGIRCFDLLLLVLSALWFHIMELWLARSSRGSAFILYEDFSGYLRRFMLFGLTQQIFEMLMILDNQYLWLILVHLIMRIHLRHLARLVSTIPCFIHGYGLFLLPNHQARRNFLMRLLSWIVWQALPLIIQILSLRFTGSMERYLLVRVDVIQQWRTVVGQALGHWSICTLCFFYKFFQNRLKLIQLRAQAWSIRSLWVEIQIHFAIQLFAWGTD